MPRFRRAHEADTVGDASLSSWAGREGPDPLALPTLQVTAILCA